MGLVLLLNVGREENHASYVSGSGTITLKYIVQHGHCTENLDFHRTNTLLLPPGAYIRRLSDVPTTNAKLIFPPYVESISRYGICINGLSPKVKDIFIPEELHGSVLRLDSTIRIVVQFTFQVTVLAKSLKLTLDVGGREREAVYVSGNNTDSLSFAYTVVFGDQPSSHTLKCRIFKSDPSMNIVPVYQYSSNPTVLADMRISEYCGM